MTKASLIAAAVLGVLVLASAPQAQTPAQAQARPPWCSTQKSLNAAERTICASQSLSQLDNQLSMIFTSALKSVGKERARLQKSQADWVRVTRNGCNDDDICLAEVYQRRIAIVRSIDNRGSIEPNGIH